MNRKRILSLTKLAVSAGLIWVLYRRVPLADFAATAADLRLFLLAPVLLLLVLNTLLSAWKWQILLRADGITISLRRLFTSYIIGTFFNLFLPSNIGGDAYRVVDIGRHSARGVNAFASVLADRLSGFLALVTLALIAAIPVAWHSQRPLLLAIPLAAAAGVATAVWCLSARGPARTLLRLTRLNRVPRLADLVERIIVCFTTYRQRPAVVRRIMALSFLFQLSVISCVALLAAVLRIDARFIYFAAFVPLITLMEAMPISIYGIGVRDAGYAFFFAFAGMTAIQTRALALLYLLTNVLYSLLGGIVFLCMRPAASSAAPAGAPGRGSARRGYAVVALSLLVWLVFAWPLPRYIGHGIPSAARNVERFHARAMIPGDHLQLLYHFRLAADMAAGGTPWLTNPYEFNTGDGDAPREPDALYLPFSALFAAAAPLTGDAAAWNLTGLIALLLTAVFTARLAVRYGACRWAALAAAAIAITLPYRWITLLGGSPTGFAMALVPMLWLGLDVAVRDGRAAGGWLAGFALLAAYCSDLHVYFFAALSVPCWCLLAWVRARMESPDDRWPHPASLLRALLPTIMLALVSVVLSRAMSASLAASDAMGGGWSMGELARYAPSRNGLWTWRNAGLSNQIYVGLLLPAALATGFATLTVRVLRARPRRWQALLVPALLLAGIAGVVVLALGANGPRGGLALECCRKLIPPYRMVRQSAKVFCLMPTLLAMAGAVVLTTAIARPRLRAAIAAGVALLAAAGFRAQVSPSICLLDREQGAYAAIADAAASAGRIPRALALPLWPGDSHWSSLYQHHALTYHIRMVNGYRPAIPQGYVENVFKRFESLNLGMASDDQLDALLERGIDYLLIHEDAFPEKVSPFPVDVTLTRLRAHPRLAPLARDGNVWAFRIARETQAAAAAVTQGADALYCPSLHWEFERLASDGGAVREIADASGGAAIVLGALGETITLPFRAPITNYPDLRISLRVRGAGVLRATGDVGSGEALHIDHADWRWVDMRLIMRDRFCTPRVAFQLDTGAVDLDCALLAAGTWASPMPGASHTWPAARFFHAGCTDESRDAVHLRRDRDPDRVVLYGPLLPLEPGVYTIGLTFTADTSPDVVLGRLRATTSAETSPWVDVCKGKPAQVRFNPSLALPLRVEFEFARAADVAIASVTIARTGETP